MLILFIAIFFYIFFLVEIDVDNLGEKNTIVFWGWKDLILPNVTDSSMDCATEFPF